MVKLPILKPGDAIEIIAPASRCSDKLLKDIKNILESWQLHCIIEPGLFGNDLLCANSDAQRFKALKNALERSDTKAILCARGGYGSMRLIPELYKIQNATPKLFIGMSDITALHLFLEQQWQWPTLHAALALDKFSEESVDKLKSILFGGIQQLCFSGTALNEAATKTRIIETSITGGNLCLVQTSIGTGWQMNGNQKIIFLEEVSERGYRIDRMLEHLSQAQLFSNAEAIIFGDFIDGNEPNGSSLIQPVLKRFAENCSIPVIQMPGIGHGAKSYPLPLGTKVTLTLGDNIKLTC